MNIKTIKLATLATISAVALTGCVTDPNTGEKRISNAAIGQHPPASMLGFATAYAVVYDVILLTVTAVIFKRRNFK